MTWNYYKYEGDEVQSFPDYYRIDESKGVVFWYDNKYSAWRNSWINSISTLFPLYKKVTEEEFKSLLMLEELGK